MSWRLLDYTMVSAAPERALKFFAESGVILTDLRFKDALTISFRIRERDERIVALYAKRNGDTLKREQEHGVKVTLLQFISRPVLILGIFLLLSLSIFLSERILLIEVKGADSVPYWQIIQEAEKCGVAFGAPSREIRSQEIKNELIAHIPQLQWVGVNIRGSVVTIHVSERQQQPQNGHTHKVGSIVAKHDGIIKMITATKGNVVCSVGQSVREGSVLISGYTDCGNVIKAEMAEGEIYAQTKRTLEVVSIPPVFRCDDVGVENRYYLRVGKNIINFSKDSGISDSSCVKMYSEDYVELPGGFRLPIAVISETVIHSTSVISDDYPEESFLIRFARSYLNTQMVAGNILTEQYLNLAQGCIGAEYTCLEMIGQYHSEEINQLYE